MATRVQKAKVGIFLVVCFLLMAAGLSFVGGLYQDHGMHYSIEFEESVLGLYEGGMVEYLGVPVGKVRNIAVTKENRALVEVVIDPKKVTLNHGVEAQLVIYSLAAGTMAISLDGGSPAAGPLPEGSQIPTKPAIITAVSSQLEGFMDNLTSIAESINTGLEGMEQGDLSTIVDKADQLIEEAKAFLGDGREVLDETGQTVAELKDDVQGVIGEARKLSEDLRGLTGDIDKLVVETTDKVEKLEVGQTQAQLNQVLENIAALSHRINTKMAEFDNLTANVLHEADNVEYSLRKTLQEMSEAFDAMRIFVEQLKNDPSSLIRGKGNIEGSE